MGAPVQSAIVALAPGGPGETGGTDASFTVGCAGPSGLISTSWSCSQTYYVPNGYRNLALSFVVPFTGSGSSRINIQERTPIIGDMVTFYEGNCAAAIEVAAIGVVCGGGQLRDWHYSTDHKFTGSGSWTCGQPLGCGGSTRGTYST